MPALLQRLNSQDRGVTLDAQHTQRQTTPLINERGGFYLMAVKDNQKALLDRLASGLDWGSGTSGGHRAPDDRAGAWTH